MLNNNNKIQLIKSINRSRRGYYYYYYYKILIIVTLHKVAGALYISDLKKRWQ